MKWEYFGTGLAFLGIGITLVLALPPPWWPNMPRLAVRAGLVLGLALIVYGAAFTAMGIWPETLRPKLLPILAMCLGLTILVAGAVWFSRSDTKKHRVETPIPELGFPNLEDYFTKDFNFLSIDRTAQIRAQNLLNGLDQVIEVKIRTFRDFGSNAEFLSVFVPFFSDVRLSAMTEPFLDSLKDQIKQAREEAKLVGVQSSSPGTALSHSKDLVFSGRVYLYTMNSLDPVQLGHLVESYRKDGMYLEVRGSNYLFYQTRQNR